MKSKKTGKLTFNKSTVAQLDNQELDALRGGSTSTSSWWSNCECDSRLETTCNGGGGGGGGSINP